MGGIVLTSTRLAQAPAGTPLKSGLPTSGLTLLWSATDPIKDLVGKLAGTVVGTWTPSKFPLGIGYRASSANYLKFAPPSAANSSDYTVFAYVTDDTGSGASRNPFDADDQTSNRTFQLRFQSNDGVEFIAFNTGGTPYFATSAAITWASRSGLLVGRVMGNQLSVWWQGRQYATGTATGTIKPVSQAAALTVGVNLAFSGSAFNPFGGGIHLAGHYNRGLSDAEIAAMSAFLSYHFADDELLVLQAAGGTTFTKTLAASATASTVFARNAALLRAANSAASAAIARAAASSKSGATTVGAARISTAKAVRSASTAGAGVVVRQPGLVKVASSAASAALAAIKTKLLSLAASATTSATVVRLAAAVRAVALTASPMLVRAVAAAKSASASAGGGLQRGVSAGRAASSAATAGVASVKAKLLTLAASATASASVARSVAAVRAATATTGAALAKVVRLMRAASSSVVGVVGLLGGVSGALKGSKGYVAALKSVKRVAYAIGGRKAKR